MKRITSIKVAVIVFGLFAPSVVPNAQAQCSDKTLKGYFALVGTGDVVTGANPGPRAVVGLLTADGGGNFSGSTTKSSNGTISQNLSVNGTYTVNSDCTGSATFTDSESETRNFDFVIVEKPGGYVEVLGIQTDDGHVATFNLKYSAMVPSAPEGSPEASPNVSQKAERRGQMLRPMKGNQM